MDIRKIVKKEVLSLKAYSAKEIPCRVKLDANESPYGFRNALKAAAAIETNRYPDPEAKELKRLVAKDLRVRPDNILQGNGSDELIYYVIATFGAPVLYRVPTFSMYGIIAQALGEAKIEIGLDRNFDLDSDRMLSAIRNQNPKLVFLSTPNNPTGNCFSSETVLKIVERSKGIVVIDEAYQAFAGARGFLPLLGDYPNVLIMRTLSKIGLAALRTGFLIGAPEIIEEVNKVRLPFNVNALSQAVAIDALKRKSEMKAAVAAIVSGRKVLVKEMAEIPGVEPFPSEANFILFRVGDAEAVYKGLLRRGVLVRNLDPGLKGCLRVTVGTPAENAAFIAALKAVLGKGGKDKR